MKTSIKINDQYIQKILLGSTPVQRIYLSGSIVYEAGVQPKPTPCFEVVSAISKASGDYVDVYVKGDSKWYKKNNLNQYEEYGLMTIVSDLSSTTYYTGKLVILSTDSHEYKWNGSEWIDLGNAGTFRDIIVYDGGVNGHYPIEFGYYWGNRYKMVIKCKRSSAYSSELIIHNSTSLGSSSPIELGMYSNGYHLDRHDPESTSNYNCYTYDYSNRVYKWDSLTNCINVNLDFEIQLDKVVVKNSDTGDVVSTVGTTFYSGSWYNGLYMGKISVPSSAGLSIYGVKVYDDNENLIHNYEFKYNGDVSENISIYDSITHNEYSRASGSDTCSYHTEYIGELVPPVDYDEKVAPADNVHYNTLAELELMECPWIGMTATVGQDYTVYVYTENGWVIGELPLDLPYIKFTATENTEITFSQDGLEYSIDGGAWKTMSAKIAVSVPASSYIIFKGKCTPTSSNGIGTFSATGGFNVSGNIMSLLFGNDFTDKVSLAGKDYAFLNLFLNNTKLYDATNLVMPATTLSQYCYKSLFKGCTSLKSVNSNLLPATTLAYNCYNTMFYSCTSLTASPLLPATNLAPYCYYTMFQECNLSTLPELPATVMVEHCYDTMFNYVNASIPDNYLPSTQLAPYCYAAMFANAFRRTKTMSILPATTLASHCYDNMFINNNNITEAPVLPAETLVDNCYSYMLYGCRNLSKVVAKFTTTPSSSYTYNWLSNNTATFYKNPNATWDQTISRGSSTVPDNWTITDIPTANYLKFTTVDDNGSTYAFSNAGLEYSIDGGEWTTLAANTDTPNVPNGSNIRFRGNLTPNGSEGIGRFSSSGKFDAEGELITLLYGEYYVGQTGKFANYMFRQMFTLTKIVNAYNLVIPYNSGSYNYSCYYMFNACSELAVAPKELKGDTYVSNYSFYQMFGNCTKLTKTPIIWYTFPAYDAMNRMFVGDALLSEVYLMQTHNDNHVDNLRSDGWLRGVAATGTLYVNQNLTWVDTIKRSEHTIPAGWTIVKVDPNNY